MILDEGEADGEAVLGVDLAHVHGILQAAVEGGSTERVDPAAAGRHLDDGGKIRFM